MDVEGADPDGASDDGAAAGGDLLGEFDRFRGGLSSPFFSMVVSIWGDGISGEVVPSASKMAGVRSLSSARRYPPGSGQDSRSKFLDSAELRGARLLTSKVGVEMRGSRNLVASFPQFSIPGISTEI